LNFEPLIACAHQPRVIEQIGVLGAGESSLDGI
jgi:hypothetical protein